MMDKSIEEGESQEVYFSGGGKGWEINKNLPVRDLLAIGDGNCPLDYLAQFIDVQRPVMIDQGV